MEKCIIEYNGEDHKCFCNKLSECPNCNNRWNRESEEECKVSPNGFCTCRLCGYAVRANK